MEFIIIAIFVWAAKGGFDHLKADYRRSRGARIAQVAKSHPKGILPKHKRASVARQHASGYWLREALHGFPVYRTGVHSGWIAHKTARTHAEAKRAEAKTAHIETAASVRRTLKEQVQRQREAAAEAEAVWETAPVPVGKPRARAQAVADIAEARRRKAAQGGSAGGGSPDVPPLPSDTIRRPAAGPYSRRDRLSDHVEPGDPLCRACRGTGDDATGTGTCHECRGWGTGPGDPDAPEAAEGAICAACGNPGRPGDPVVQDGNHRLHRSHITEDIALRDEARYDQEAADIARGFEFESCEHCGGDLEDHVIAPDPLGHAHSFCTDDPECPEAFASPDASRSPAPIPASTATRGPTVADTTYDSAMARSAEVGDHAEGLIADITTRRQEIEQMADDMQGSGVGAKTVSAAMDAVDQWAEAEKALTSAAEAEQNFAAALQTHYADLNEAHQNASDGAADKEFHEG